VPNEKRAFAQCSSKDFRGLSIFTTYQVVLLLASIVTEEPFLLSDVKAKYI
jgi:hypothetical protein